MLEKVSWIIIPFLIFVCVVICIDVRLLSTSNNRGDLELLLSNHSQETFHHNHCEEPEIPHEDFFHQSDLSFLSVIHTPRQKLHQDIMSFPKKTSFVFWHPPKTT
jgi:hypothetical protein